MVESHEQVRRILELAERVEADIRQRRLGPGDRYLTTADAAKMLRVDTAMANRALQLLVKRKLLERSQRVGSVVAEGYRNPTKTTLHRVHLLFGDTYPQSEHWLDTGTLMAMQNELPSIRLQFHFLTTGEEETQVDQVIQEAFRAPESEAFVLLRTSLSTQRMFQDSGLVAAVFGHPYVSIKRLPFADRDQRQIGQLMAEYLVGHGHRRVAMLMRQRPLPGDHELIEGARDVLDVAGLSPRAISMLCLPQDREEVRHALMRLVGESGEFPGVMARPPLMADAALELARSRRLKPQQDVAIVAADYFANGGTPPYAVIRPVHKFDEQGSRLGKLIVEVARGNIPEGSRHLAPVRLEVPQ